MTTGKRRKGRPFSFASFSLEGYYPSAGKRLKVDVRSEEVEVQRQHKHTIHFARNYLRRRGQRVRMHTPHAYSKRFTVWWGELVQFQSWDQYLFSYQAILDNSQPFDFGPMPQNYLLPIPYSVNLTVGRSIIGLGLPNLSGGCLQR
jgi:hypothetical protein